MFKHHRRPPRGGRVRKGEDKGAAHQRGLTGNLVVSHSPAIRPWRWWRASLSCASRCAKDSATARRSPQVSLLAPSDSLRHEDVPRQSRWPTVTKRPDASTRFSMTFRRATTELYMYMLRILQYMSYVVVEVGWDWTGAECVGVGLSFWLGAQRAAGDRQ